VSDCLDENAILELLRGRLARSDEQRAEAHLASCPDCRRLMSELAKSGILELDETIALQHPPPPPEDTFSPGAMIDRFKVVRLIAKGGMGEVYLARDTKLGRKIALKVIRASTVGSRAAQALFLREAKSTAQFNHPHIVTLYDAGEHAGHLFLALEHVEGDSLRTRTAEARAAGGLGAMEAMRIARAIADALEEAHRRGILHRDLKPSNVLLAKDGRVRIIDFGLARDVTEAPTKPPGAIEPRSPAEASYALGTPAYMAPEQWLGKATGPAADVWALGIIVYELLAGTRPYRGSTEAIGRGVCAKEPVPRIEARSDISPSLIDLISRMVDKVEDRRPSAREAKTALDAILHQRAARSEEASPFRGLLPFHEQDRDLFFGRDDEIVLAIERLREEALLPIVGPSGAGKSSFVEAGLIPRLKEGGRWTTLELRTSHDPFGALARAIDRTDVDVLSRALFESPPRLYLELEAIAKARRTKVLLFVDQLEEIHTLVPNVDVRGRFLSALFAAGDDPEGPIRIVFTLRDDFLARIAEHADVRRWLSRVLILRSPAPEMLEAIVARPLEAVGYRFDDPKLAAEMASAVKGEAACLPVLEFAAELLWEKRDRHLRLLTRSAYEAMGGVGGALATHADGALARLSKEDVEIARRILLRLVTPEGTRRSISTDLDARHERVLGELIDARLVAVRSDEGVREIELAHESLIATWRTLARWIDESKEERVLLDEISRAARSWARRGKRKDDVWQGRALEDASRLVERIREEALPEMHAFLAAGRANQRRRERTKTIAIASAAVAIVAAIAVLHTEQQAAIHARNLARERWAAAERERAIAALAGGDVLEARARTRSTLEAVDSAEGRVLWWRIERSKLLARTSFDTVMRGFAVSPDQRTAALSSIDRTITLVDLETFERRSMKGQAERTSLIRFSPDGRRLASAAKDGDVAIVDLASAAIEHVATLESAPISLAFDRAEAIDVVDEQQRAHRFDLATKYEIEGPARGPDGPVKSADGRRIAVIEPEQRIRIVDAKTMETVDEIGGFQEPLIGVAFRGPDAVVAATYHSLVVERIAPTSPAKSETGHKRVVIASLISPDQRTVASGGTDAAVRLWDVERGEEIAVFQHDGPVHGLAFDAEGKRLASSSSDRGVRIFDLLEKKEIARFFGHRGPVYSIAFRPNRNEVASAGRDRTVRIWDLDRARLAVVFDAAVDVRWIRFSKDGTNIYACEEDGRIEVFDVDKKMRSAILGRRGPELNHCAVSPDERSIVTVSENGAIGFVDLATGDPRAFAREDSQIGAVVYAPSGDEILTAGAAGLFIWSIADGKRQRIWRGRGDQNDVEISNDGRIISTTGDDGTVRLFDRPSLRPRWWAPILVPSSGLVFRHGRWARISESGRAVPAEGIAPSAWRDAIADRARYATIDELHGTACLATFGDAIELWRIDGTHPLAMHRGAPIADVAVADDRCLARTEAGVVLVRSDGDAIDLGAPASAIASDPKGGFWIARGGEIARFGGDGRKLGAFPLSAPATAIGVAADEVQVGFEDGRIARVDGTGMLERASEARPSRIAILPSSLLAAGYESGAVELWDRSNGAHLEHARLHGPIMHLAFANGRLVAVSELGSTLAWDLSAFLEPWCELLGAVWKKIPIVAENGRLIEKSAPIDHPCRGKEIAR
jgi:serine/threonine protein kinase/WD40 repeat protein